MSEIQRKHPLAKCEECPLYKQDYVPTSGPPDAEIAFVSRSPGYHDSIAKRPFAGPSGRVLDALLENNKVKRSDIITTNVVLCYHDGEPPQSAIEACADRLNADIAECGTVLAGGVEAVHSLINPRWAIASARSRIHTINGQRRIATYNPAVVLRESGNYPSMVRDFRFAINPVPKPKMPRVWYTEDPTEAIEFLKSVPDRVDSTNPIASDLEGWIGNVVCAGFALDLEMAYVIGQDALQHDSVWAALKELYEYPLNWTWHNGKYDVKVLAHYGIKADIVNDTFLLSYALDERPGGNYQGDQGAGLHALTPTLIQEYGWPDYEHESVKYFKKNGKWYGDTPERITRSKQEMYDYNGKDCVGTLVLYEDFVPAAKADDVYVKPYQTTFIPLANALVPVERRGIHFNKEGALDLLERDIFPKLNQLVLDMRRILGLQLYNPGSSQQNRGIFYSMFGLKHGLQDTRKKKKSDSTDRDVRKEILEGRFEVTHDTEKFVEYVQLLDDYWKIKKSWKEMLISLIEKVDDNGKLTTTFKFGTETGRLSSEKPNFQQITRAGAFGLPSLRSLFLPSPGNVIVSADFSQAELRTIAKLATDTSGDVSLLSIYRDSSRSLHKERAAQFFGPDYTKEQYVIAKNINFGVTYLQSAFTFAQMYNIPQEQAQAYIDDWFASYPGILEWIKLTVEDVKTAGYIRSPFGHKRRFHLLTKENFDEVVKQAVNFKPQNVAGVLTEHALIELVDLGVPIISSTHDSIVADVPSDDAHDVAALMQDIMQKQAPKHLGWEWDDVPFAVDVSIGPNWGDVEEVQLNNEEKVAA